MTTTTTTAPKGMVRIERNVHGVLCVFIAGICIPAKDAKSVADVLRTKAGLDAVIHDLDFVTELTTPTERPAKIKSAKDGTGAAQINKSESERERRNANPDKASVPAMAASNGEPVKTASDIQAAINPDAKTAPKTPKQEENAADKLPPCCPKCGNSACTCSKVETPLVTEADAEKEALLAECRKRGIKARGMHWMKADKLRQLIADQDWAATKHQEILDKPAETVIAGQTDKPGVFLTTATGHDGVVYTLYRKDNGEIVARVMGKLANAS